MKKKILLVLLCMVSALCLCFGLTACGDNDGGSSGGNGNGGSNEHIHKLTYFEAKGATCFEDGNSFYYICADCRKWFADSEGHTEITDKTSVVIAKRHNNLLFIEKQPADCYNDGHYAYYRCGDCDKWFSDEKCNYEIADKSSIVIARGHNLSFIEAKSPTCTDMGNIAYYKCGSCGQCFTDEKCEKIIYFDDTILRAKHSDLTFVEGREPTCAEEGIISYYICGVCGKYCIDEWGEIDEAYLLIPKKRHEMETVSSKEATCTLDGNIMYFTCATCDNWFYDSKGSEVITDKSSVVIEKGHKLTFNAGVEATCKTYGSIEYYACWGCGKWYKEESCENEIVDKNIIVEKTGHTYSGKACTLCGSLKPTDGLEYDNYNSTSYYTVTGIGTATDTDIVIPEEYCGEPVVGIGYNAFKNCAELTSITIPETVNSISSTALEGCVGLKNITVSEKNRFYFSKGNCLIQYYDNMLIRGCNNSVIPDDGSVKVIVPNAFSDCSEMTNIIIPDSIKSIGDKAFANCSKLENIVFSKNLLGIGSEVFLNCVNLSSIDIPDSVANVDEDAFAGCKFTNVTMPTSAILAISNTNPETIVITCGDFIPTNAFKDCTSLTSVTIQNGVRNISDYAFYGCTGIKNIIIPSSVMGISWFAFAECSNLESVIIEKGVQGISQYAFSGCNSLISVTIPESVTYMQYNIFSGSVMVIYCIAKSKPDGWDNNWKDFNSHVVWDCENNEIAEDGYTYTVSNGVRYALKGEEAVVTYQGGQASGNVIIPENVNYKDKIYNVTSIRYSAFSFCDKLTGVEMPESVIKIGPRAFEYCFNIKNIEIPNNVTTIDDATFIGCWGLENVILSENVAVIKREAFSGCRKLANIEIPESVTTIGERAFSECTAIKKITLGNNVASIEGGAFEGCINLIVHCKQAQRLPGWIDNWNGDCLVVLNCESNNLAEDGNFYIINDGIRYILDNEKITVAKQSSWLSGDIVIPQTIDYEENTYEVLYIGEGAFKNCSKILSISLSESILEIGNSAFDNCGGLKCINVSEDNSNYISQDGILYNSDKAKIIHVPKAISGNVTIAEEIMVIDEGQFMNCSNLNSIILTESVITICSDAFRGCSNLTSITIPKNVMLIGNNVFADCSSLASIIVAEDNNMFSSQDGILYNKDKTEIIHIPTAISGNVTIAEGITAISDAQFKNCTNLESIILADSVTYIYKAAFNGCSSLKSITISNGVTVIESNAFNGCSSMTEINFDGTKIQWEAIEKGYNWNANTGEYTIHCTDGDISK